MTRLASTLAFTMLLASACGGSSGGSSNESTASGNKTSGSSAAKLIEGKDYVVLERVRILDEMGFDQPVEAMSVLLPRGWKTESGVRWKGVNECRGEIVTWQMKATSPDGEIEFLVLPVRSFIATQDQMLRQSLMAAAQQGGCAVSPPFDATQYLNEVARTTFAGATVSDVREDESLRATMEKMNAQANAISAQYGTGMHQTGTGVYGTLTWPDGRKGLANVGVSVTQKGGTDYFGNPNGFATTMVFHQVYMRYPAAREAEAIKLFGTVTSSHRVNPAWQQAKDNFLTRLGNIEHAGRMERIRLMGEQSRAYAKAQSEASDARMRDWERSQASSDAGQSRCIQTIRGVVTWKDNTGSPVELSAGYSHGWSRPDGAIILTNSSIFDPAVELQQNWARMEKVKR